MKTFILFTLIIFYSPLLIAQNNVGIGTDTPGEKLEINGAIKIGNTSNATPASGTIRWNQTTGEFEGYSGSEWTPLSQNYFYHYTNTNSTPVLNMKSPGLILELNSSYPQLNSVQIDQDKLIELYGDVDGCRVTMILTDWSSSFPGGSSIASFDFSYSPVQVNGHHYFRTGTGSVQGWDGDNNVNHAFNLHDSCYLTDAVFTNGSSNDNSVGLNLLKWSVNAPTKKCTCVIED